MKRTKTREIYNQKYYKAKIMLDDPWFKRRIRNLNKKFEQFGYPIPKTGFKTLEEQIVWRNKKYEIDLENQVKKRYQKEVKKIVGDKKKWDSKTQYKLDALKVKLLPPVVGEESREILKHFNINSEDRGFLNFLEQYFFFKKNVLYTPTFHISWMPHFKTGKMELYIKLSGHTTKEDIVDNWDNIAKEQKLLLDYVGKNKEWIYFKRDNEIYQLYLKLRSERKGKRSELSNSLEKQIYDKLGKKYRLNLSDIRHIVSKVKKKSYVDPKGTL